MEKLSFFLASWKMFLKTKSMLAMSDRTHLLLCLISSYKQRGELDFGSDKEPLLPAWCVELMFSWAMFLSRRKTWGLKMLFRGRVQPWKFGQKCVLCSFGPQKPRICSSVWRELGPSMAKYESSELPVLRFVRPKPWFISEVSSAKRFFAINTNVRNKVPTQETTFCFDGACGLQNKSNETGNSNRSPLWPSRPPPKFLFSSIQSWVQATKFYLQWILQGKYRKAIETLLLVFKRESVCAWKLCQFPKPKLRIHVHDHVGTWNVSGQ